MPMSGNPSGISSIVNLTILGICHVVGPRSVRIWYSQEIASLLLLLEIANKASVY